MLKVELKSLEEAFTTPEGRFGLLGFYLELFLAVLFQVKSGCRACVQIVLNLQKSCLTLVRNPFYFLRCRMFPR